MIDLDQNYILVDEKQKKQERAKARDLRRSSWWKNKLQEAVCYYCEKKIEAKFITMDHKVPISKGGKSTKNNIVLCCKSCNTKKQNNNATDILIKT